MPLESWNNCITTIASRYNNNVKSQIFKRWKPQQSLQFIPHWILALGIYLILVWGFALIRSKYLWITGDDPNLLVQSILTFKGQKPNIDFESGYPGLSQFTQAGLMHIFGVNIFSQHLYTALMSSFTGILVCINFRHLPNWVLSTGLIVIYSQEHLVNPTPNPGHLFVLLALIAFTISNKKIVKNEMFQIIINSILLGISFLAKQYALFVLLGFILMKISNFHGKNNNKSNHFFIGFLGIAAATSYYIGLIPNGDSKVEAIGNLVILLTPYLIFVYINSKVKLNVTQIGIRALLKSISVSTLTFSCTVIIGLSVLYRTTDVIRIIEEILIEMPRRINSNIVLIQISHSTIQSLVAFTIFLSACLILIILESRKFTSKKKQLFYKILAIFMAILGFSKIGNLSGNLALSILPILIITYYYKDLREFSNSRKLFFFILTTYQFILIPYPNINFHILIYVATLFILISDVGDTKKSDRISVAILLPIFLTILLLVHEVQTLDSMKNYRYGDITFQSQDVNWQKIINEAKESKGDYLKCKSRGCEMLILLSNH